MEDRKNDIREMETVKIQKPNQPSRHVLKCLIIHRTSYYYKQQS